MVIFVLGLFIYVLRLSSKNLPILGNWNSFVLVLEPDFFDLLSKFFALICLMEQECNIESGNFPVIPLLYNPLDEPSPLGLRLKKSPSFLDLIQMKLSQDNADKLTGPRKKDSKGITVSSVQDKLKAANFPASLLRIGPWEVFFIISLDFDVFG